MFVKTLKDVSADFPLRFSEQMILLSFCSALVVDDDHFLQLCEIRPFLAKKSKFGIREFVSGENILFKAGLLEHLCDQGIADTEKYCLTDKAKETFLSDVDLRDQKNTPNNSMIAAKTITEKELYYSNKICRQVGELTGLLREENFSNIVQRLKERNMKTGCACLFCGPPGTGKTETAYQIARATGRDIMPVDIADTKSMWFGESEKKIKAIFDRYQSMVKKNKGVSVPILLFNEADAVLGKRQQLGETRRGPAQTENAIQNIILQEMENLSGGILIATTNMIGNFDKAFERRFLYKIEFEKPDFTAKAAIWRDMISGLAVDAACTLSRRFDFSGGQIENVARKAAISNLLHEAAHDPALDRLITFCEEELLDTHGSKPIGFAV
jgi:SpoVK/Ycf46/Vps4 family AAA+-type ATPase